MTERTDPGYARSTLWTSGEWRRHVLAGAAQAFDSRLPAVRWDQTLTQALATATGSPIRLALDNYEAPSRLAAPSATTAGDIALAIGPERGWGPTDRAALRAAGFALHNLGPRVLRTETAVTAALAILAPG